jgi:proteasome lid subunit RPN8/RPN11
MTISSRVLDDVVAHARECQPRECCGLLVGEDRRIVASLRATNLADSPSRFLIDPKDHIDARRTARAKGLDVIGFYHSHPHSGADPSPTDIAEATYPDAVQLIVGWNGERADVRLFKFVDGKVEEVSLDLEI